MKISVIFAPEICIKDRAYLIRTRNSHRIQSDNPEQSGSLKKKKKQITVKGSYIILQASI